MVMCTRHGCKRFPRVPFKKRHPLDFAFNPFDFVGLVAKVMSEKATGFDWRCRSKTRVVHGAGSSKYIG